MAARRLPWIMVSVALALGCGPAQPTPAAPRGAHDAPAALDSGAEAAAQTLVPDDDPVAPALAAAAAPTAPAPAPPADLAAAPPFAVFTEPGELPHLSIAGAADERLPLRHTAIHATLAGFVAEVEITQRYDNPRDGAIEASYVFPLPENAAVHALSLRVGTRVVDAEVQERAAARRTYEAARSAGHTAALLEQERPNVFTQSVANIPPHEHVEVTVRYVQDLSYDAGTYELVVPLGVGPRYVPGAPVTGPASGHGTYADTTRVADASRITPPIVGRGQRSGHDVSLAVDVSGTGLVGDVEVPTHEVTARRSDGLVHVELSARDSLPNRDFVLRYRVAGESPHAVLRTSGASDGYFSLIVQPPQLDVDALVGRRELVFVVDVSGSMQGLPLALCKQAMREALGRLRPVDTFDVLVFSGATARLFGRPRPANEAALRQALGFVDRLTAGGGTELGDAVTAALAPDVEQGRDRYVFFMTDGYVGDEAAIVAKAGAFVAAMGARGQRARVFGFGVGSAPNRALMDGLAREGKGLVVSAAAREDPARAVAQFFRVIDHAVLRDVRVDYGGLDVDDVTPREAQDLFASRPLVLHGRFHGRPTGHVVVRAVSERGAITLPVAIAPAPATDGWPLQGLLWARARIADRQVDLADPGGYDDARREVTALGVTHHLVTPFTSFVAVDRSRVVGDGGPEHVTQAVMTPEGVDADRAGARPSGEASGGAYGYQFSDDPLAAGGFGPSDATIRSRALAVAPRAPEQDARAPRDLVDGDPVEPEAQGATVPAVAPSARGCFCELGGEGDAPAGVAALALGLWVAVARRGRRFKA